MADKLLRPTEALREDGQLTTYSFDHEYAWALIAVACAAVLSLVVSFQVGVFALVFALAAWWAWLNPVQAFFFWLVISPLLPMFKVTQTLGNVTLVKDVVILALFLKLFVLPLVRHTLPYRRIVLAAPLVGLALWTAFALLRADAMLVGILRARDIILYALLYVVVLYVPFKKRHYREMLWWLGLSFVCVALLGAYQWFFAIDSAVLRFDPVRQIWIPRVSSTFGHPSVYGEYLIIITAVCGACTLVAKQKWTRVAAGVGSLVALVAIYFTYSRAVWLGLVAALSAIAIAYIAQLLWRRQVKQSAQQHASVPTIVVAFVIAVVAIVGVWRYTAVGTFVQSAFDTTYKSNSERLEFLARLIGPTTNSQAIIGQGLGDVTLQNFREIELGSFDIASGASRSIQVAKDTTLVDNQHLKTFIEMGLIGLLIYAWIYWRLLRASWQLTKDADDTAKIIGYVGLGTLVAFIIQGFFIDIWDIFPTNAYFWIIAGFISRNTR